MKLVALVDKKGIKSDFACSKGFVVRQSPNWFAMRTFPRHDKTSELALFIWLIGKVHVVNIRHKQTSFMQTSSTVHGQELYRQSPSG